MRDNNGFTPLHLSLLELKTDNVHLLINHGANVNIKSKIGISSKYNHFIINKGLTPLLLVCNEPFSTTAYNIGLILNAGANVNDCDENGWVISQLFYSFIFRLHFIAALSIVIQMALQCY